MVTTPVRVGRRVTASWLLALSLTSLSCSASYGDQLDTYYRSVLSNQPQAAFDLLCKPTRTELGTPQALAAAADSQKGRIHLKNDRVPLRGDDDVAASAFDQVGGGTVTLEVPVRWVGDKARFCPSADRPLGEVVPD